MPALCLVLAALLTTHEPGPECARRLLDEQALDRITAAGVVSADASRVKSESHLRVEVSGSTQAASRALNVVNATGSVAASGLNAVSGLPRAAAGETPEITQRNAIAQDVRSPGRVEFWQRSAGIQEHAVASRTTSFEGRVDPAVLPLFGTQSGVVEDDDREKKETRIVIGSGVAAAGAVDAHFGSGLVDFSFEVSASSTTTATTCILWWCSTDSASLNGRATLEGHSMASELSLRIDEGVMCAAVIATCSASGTIVSESQLERHVTAPADATGLHGEYIAAGESGVIAYVDATVSVHNSAQEGIRAMNVTNASRSTLANGVNVSRGGASAGSPRWQQANTIVQSR